MFPSYDLCLQILGKVGYGLVELRVVVSECLVLLLKNNFPHTNSIFTWVIEEKFQIQMFLIEFKEIHVIRH